MFTKRAKISSKLRKVLRDSSASRDLLEKLMEGQPSGVVTTTEGRRFRVRKVALRQARNFTS